MSCEGGKRERGRGGKRREGRGRKEERGEGKGRGERGGGGKGRKEERCEREKGGYTAAITECVLYAWIQSAPTHREKGLVT